MGLSCRGYSPKNLCEFLHEAPGRFPFRKVGKIQTPIGGRKETVMEVNSITNNKPSRVTEMLVGDTLFTVVSVESDRAREHLYDKVKRMILNDENTETLTAATAA